MKSLTTLKLGFCFYLFFGFALTTEGQGGDYYTYQDSSGKLVISNKQPPPGSKIIKKQNLPDVATSQVQDAQENDGKQLTGNTEGSPKRSQNK